ncbi:putative non-specific serine/threonine protein kinase [Helianthus debilis subsp. tardiflorus]
MFELGFFSPGNSKNRYLGIWYKKISTGTVVWVANRETPITDNSGMFKVSNNGTLVILSGGNIVVWSSNSTGSECSNNLAVVHIQTDIQFKHRETFVGNLQLRVVITVHTVYYKFAGHHSKPIYMLCFIPPPKTLNSITNFFINLNPSSHLMHLVP